jgi:hypothetical protein
METPDELDQFVDPMDMWDLLQQLKSQLDATGSITTAGWNAALSRSREQPASF